MESDYDYMHYRKLLLVPGSGWALSTLPGLDHAETLTYAYLVKQGYTAIKIRPNQKFDPKTKAQLNALRITTSLIKTGVPDFLAWKGNRILFIEVKGGKAPLSNVQLSWISAFSDVYDILSLKVKLDETDLLAKLNQVATEGAIIDRDTKTVETLDNLQDVDSNRRLAIDPELEPFAPKEIDLKKEEQRAYYHLIAMEYSDTVIEDAKSKLKIILKDKNPDRYKEAYHILREALDKSKKISDEHREKIKRILSGVIPSDNLNKIIKRRSEENNAMAKIYLKSKKEDNVEIQVKTGLQLSEESNDKTDDS